MATKSRSSAARASATRTSAARRPASAGVVDAVTEVLTENWWAVALRGGLGILFGLVALFMPIATLIALVYLFAAYMFIDGIFAVVSAARAARAGEQWGLLVFEGIVGIVVGVVAVLWPAITVTVFVLLVGVWALITGVLMLSAAIKLHMEHGRWLLGLAGVASVLFGIALIVWPPVGALVLTLWIGAYALVFGTLLLVLGFELRARRR
jgi:uncharacterized membrane protein HdeD (DUF308 family)